MKDQVYLDHSATSPVSDRVVKRVVEVMSEVYGNPSSLHGLGWEASRVVEAARDRVARQLSAPAETICFTSGGSEANNLILTGAMNAYRNRGRHLITAATEHSSMLEPAHRLRGAGFEVTILDVDGAGRIDPDRLASAITPGTVLVSLMHVNNETGTMHPVRDLGQVVKERRRNRLPLFHVDAVQSFARYPLEPGRWGIDLLTMSGHKIGGPKGVGAVYVGAGVRLEPLIVGGQQEKGLRAGTENVPGIAGMAEAVELMASHDDLPGRWTRLKEGLLAGLEGRGQPWYVNGGLPNGGQSAPHIISLSFPGLPGEVMARQLETRGIYVSTGSACHSRNPEPSHVLVAMGLEPGRVRSAIRISFGPDTCETDIDVLVEALVDAASDIRAVGGRRHRS